MILYEVEIDIDSEFPFISGWSRHVPRKFSASCSFPVCDPSASSPSRDLGVTLTEGSLGAPTSVVSTTQKVSLNFPSKMSYVLLNLKELQITK